MEVQELRYQVDELQSGQCERDSKIESVLLMQYKIMEKLHSIDKILCTLSIQRASNYPLSPFYQHLPPPSTPFSSKTFPHHSSPYKSSPSLTHPPFQLANTPIVDTHSPNYTIPPGQSPVSAVQSSTTPK